MLFNSIYLFSILFDSTLNVFGIGTIHQCGKLIRSPDPINNMKFKSGGGMNVPLISGGPTVNSQATLPWMVRVIVNIGNPNKANPMATGTLIGPKHVLTLASVVYDHQNKVDQIEVRAGHPKWDLATAIKIVRVSIYPGYQKDNFLINPGNIAILELDTVLTLNSTIYPICLTKDYSQSYLTGIGFVHGPEKTVFNGAKSAQIAGYGSMDSGTDLDKVPHELSPLLVQGTMNIIYSINCALAHIHSLTSQLEKMAVHNRRGEEKVSMEMAKNEIDMLVKFYEENQPICAEPQPSQTEYGDGGAPIFLMDGYIGNRFVQLGILTMFISRKSTKEMKYTVFESLTPYCGFIEGVLGEDVCDWSIYCDDNKPCLRLPTDPTNNNNQGVISTIFDDGRIWKELPTELPLL